VWSTSIGLGGASASAILATACCGGGHVGWMQLDFWDVAEGWVFYGLDNGGEGLSGWMVERDLALVGGLG
jgi:hypothetical protein